VHLIVDDISAAETKGGARAASKTAASSHELLEETTDGRGKQPTSQPWMDAGKKDRHKPTNRQGYDSLTS